ncbi:MAG TPA: cupredoxin family copper-binding protein [Casimicrobiaceae bacterium]
MRPLPLAGARALAAICVVALALAVVDSRAAGAARHTVTIDSFAFHPSTVTVRQGETVEWHNTDPVPHTATAKAAGLDSGAIAANGTFRFTAKKKGRFDYICTLHPIMKGELIVE